MKCILLMILVFNLNAGLVLAANWEFVGATEGHQYYIDRTSIKRIGNKIRCWEYNNFDVPRFYSQSPYTSVVMFVEYDIEMKTCRILEIAGYSEKNKTGTNVFSDEYEGNKPKRIIPDTIGENIFEYILKFVKQTKSKKYKAI